MAEFHAYSKSKSDLDPERGLFFTDPHWKNRCKVSKIDPASPPWRCNCSCLTYPVDISMMWGRNDARWSRSEMTLPEAMRN